MAIGLGALASATYAAVHGAQIAASFIGGAGITGLVTAFIAGRSFLMRQRKQEIELATLMQPPGKKTEEALTKQDKTLENVGHD